MLVLEVLPHKDEHESNTWIDECVDRPKNFAVQNNAKFFCDNGQTHDGLSCVCAV